MSWKKMTVIREILEIEILEAIQLLAHYGMIQCVTTSFLDEVG